MLGVVLPHVGAFGNLGQQLGLEDRRRACQDGLEGRLDRLAAITPKQIGDALGAHATGGDLGIQVTPQAVGQARIAHQDPDQVGVGRAG